MKAWIISLLVVVSATAAWGDRTESRSVSAVTQVDTFGVALSEFKVDCSRFPTTDEGLNVLVRRPSGDLGTNWHGPYLDKDSIPLDPWQRPFVYRCPGIHNTNGYDLYSGGPDGKSKTGGGDPDDINNWDRFSPHDRPEDHLPPAVILQWAVVGAGMIALIFITRLKLEDPVLDSNGNRKRSLTVRVAFSVAVVAIVWVIWQILTPRYVV